MKHLVLIRHAKSSMADPTLEDIDRPLNDRGRLAAPVIGAWVAELGLAPDHVFASPARRCAETWEKLRRQFDAVPDPVVVPALYMADPDTMLAVLRRAPDTANVVMMLGHQPGIGSFARKLSGGPVPVACAHAFTKYPTAAAAVFEISGEHWADVDFGAATFRHFATPKDLV